MTESSSNRKSQGRRPLRLVLGGCGLIIGLLVCALVINAVYWTNRMGGFARGSAPVSAMPIASESLLTGRAADGEALFRGDAACHVCHALESGEQGVGPSLAGIATRAATTEPDKTAEDYLLESIINPNAHIVEGFTSDIMPPNFGQRLSEQQLADLVAFLMTQN